MNRTLVTSAFALVILGLVGPAAVVADDRPAATVTLDARAALDLRAWGEQAKALCEHWYPIVCDELSVPGRTPPDAVRIVFETGMDVPAATGGNTIAINPGYVRANPGDVGMVIHELVHVAQSYPSSPTDMGWLSEGIADYVRFWQYEPQTKQEPIDPRRASYRDGYRTTAAFLAWLKSERDPQIIAKLNARLGRGTCEEGTFQELLGVGVDALWQDFVAAQSSVSERAAAHVVTVSSARPDSAPDLTRQPTLYAVGYSHLDTQWRWTYPEVIRVMIPKTMHENFKYFEQYPDFILNFSGSNRYRMMKEYYPEDYKKVKEYVAAGRWFPCGSSVEECDVVVPSAESIIRQVLYGNHYFRTEFGRSSAEFILPDCFGFPASLPGILTHCGLRGFSTQKLTWGSAVGIPFNVGVWEGLDGSELLAALNCGSYNGDIENDLSNNAEWQKRIDGNGQKYGIFADYMYYGVGDEGGAPREGSLKWLVQSLTNSGPVRVVSATAEQMFLDLSKYKLDKLPRYKGDMLLTEHSAGSISSAAYMKRWNRQNELRANAAESAAVLAEWLGGPAYPRQRLYDAWTLVLGGQFHDILPGTSLPKCYEYSWNDELLALNQFAGVLDSSIGTIAAGLDTRAQGTPIVVYNPLAIDREDAAEARINFAGDRPEGVRVVGPDGAEVPAQILGVEEGMATVLFLAKIPSLGCAVYDVQPAKAAITAASELKVTESSLENARYRVTLNQGGDIAGIYDKKAGKELLGAPIRLAFTHDKPRAWPAWNIDWSDQQKPPCGYVEGPATVEIAERGPARVALRVTRHADGSRFVETIRLAAGEAGERIEFADMFDWQGRSCSLKATFPLSVANPQATYNWGAGTLMRGNNDPKKYEVPAHQWFDLTDTQGGYGVTVLTGDKYASDKPDDRTLRLTLLRTPGTGGEYQDQATQDWGRHEMLYGLAGHEGDWRRGRTDWEALRLDASLLAFATTPHAGELGRSFSLLEVSEPCVRVVAVKKAEDSDEVIIRVVELNGTPMKNVHLRFAAPLAAAREVDGQEQPVGDAQITNGELVTDVGGYHLRAFAVKFGSPPIRVAAKNAAPVTLPYDRAVTSRDGEKSPGGIDRDGRCLPAEMLPPTIDYRGITFKLPGAAGGQPDAVTCRGQKVALPGGTFNRLYILATAGNGDRKVTFTIDGQPFVLNVQDWGGYIGQWDNRLWTGKQEEFAFEWPNELVGLRPAYVRPAPVAWFCSHRHTPAGENELYNYCYLFAYAIDVPNGARQLTLPQDEQVFVLAATVANDVSVGTHPAQPLIDELKRDVDAIASIVPAGGRFTDSTPVAIQRPLWGGDRVVRYTLDGRDPQPDSPEFSGPFRLCTDTVVKTRLFDGSGRGGPVAEARFGIADNTPPAIQDVVAYAWTSEVAVSFSEPLDPASAENVRSYQLTGGPQVRTAALSADGRVVTLTLSAPPRDGQSVLTFDGLRDRSPGGNPLTSVRQTIACPSPVLTLPLQTLDGAGGGFAPQPLPADAPLAGVAPWTLNVWLWIDEQPGDYTVIAGFGTCEDRSGTQRFLAKFPHGLHFWGSNVDIPANVPLDLGRWQMLTATFDGTTARVFKDGRALASQAIALEAAEPIVQVGPPPPWRYGQRVAGKVAGFTLWNRALPPSAVAALAEIGVPADSGN